MNNRWWLEPLRRTLLSLLAWVDAQRGKPESARGEKASFLYREIHVPTILIAISAAVALFVLLAPEVGFVSPRLLTLAGMIAMVLFFFILYFRYDLPELVNDDEVVLLTSLCLMLGVILIEIGSFIPGFSEFGVPIGAIAIVATLLLHIRLALLISVVLSLMAGVVSRYSFNATFVALLSSMTAMLAAHRVRQRSDITRAGIHVAWVTVLAIYGLGVYSGWPAKIMLHEFPWAALNGFLCIIIPLGLLPILEAFFSRLTPITLLEVGDFNRPLLRRLMLEAPGTYHHTLMVSSIAEQAADAIGANSLLCRVGMYYHDIGKLANPEYFIENQIGRRSPEDKPEHHDKLNPSISSLVIMNHVKEGIALARAYHVPEEVIRFIPEHHGTSIIKYFFMRALEEDEESLPPPESFRYPGPKPRSRETAIAMLADSVEAASRSIEEPTYERLHDMVEKVVNSKFMDGQFDEAPITMRDLRKIIENFTHSLSAVHHVRIEYPETPSSESMTETQ
jgi:putative nucleotidyltransferase with HDIG domain